MILALIRGWVRAMLWLRYRIRTQGLDKIAARGRSGILFLPTHPALIDPIILAALLGKQFAPRFVADRDQVDRFLIRNLARRIGVRTIPDTSKLGTRAREEIDRVLAESAEGLKNGENLLIYPAGHVLRSRFEEVGGNSGAETVLRAAPNARIVLVRTRGLWGSGFSWAQGAPKVGKALARGFFSILANFLFFTPRRAVSIEFVEPEDFPRGAGREALNADLERFFNADPPGNTYVPYTIWERGGARQLPEPQRLGIEGDAGKVPPATREMVIEYLREATGAAAIPDEAHLARDLGMDSLARADVGAWIEQEFGFPVADGDALQTVKDVLLAAVGQAVSAAHVELKPVPRGWFAWPKSDEAVSLPEGARNIAEAFLQQAERAPGRTIIADQAGGGRTYRDLVTAILLLKPRIEALPGERVGIMLPASVAADVLYLAVLFAGKTPVMVNWTAGVRNMVHSLDLVGAQRILTAEALLSRLAHQGLELGALEDRFVRLEELARGMGSWEKLRAAAAARLCWAPLRRARISDTAAILFTSGSESLPKAVPLSHRNILSNIADVLKVVTIRRSDRMIGFLPPFHSFGLAETMVLPLCLGLRVIYHPNPTDSLVIARLIEAYRATLLIGTPTFLHGIVRASQENTLASLRLAVTGAEKCSERVYSAIARRCPQATILEGYGVTECSPIISVNSERTPKPFTIGMVLPSLEYVRVDPESGVRAPKEMPGMLLVRGPSVFGGYMGEAPSPFVEFEGKSYYRTGDLVTEDADGVLTFAGRLRRFVKLGGEMVSLPAVEAALEPHYASDADKGPVIAVEATPDEEHPEIILFTTLELERETVNRQIRDAGLSPIHNIRRVQRIADMPLLGTGKTDYRALKAMLAAKP